MMSNSSRLYSVSMCLFIASCSSADKGNGSQTSQIQGVRDALPATYQALGAQDKLNLLWNEKIIPSRYTSFPEVLAASPTLPLINMSFTMDNVSDELPESRPKAIHKSGMVAKVAFVSEPNSPLTGLWTGSSFGLVRLSLATKSTNIVVPGSAFKMFVDGKPSQNFVAMHDLDGQSNYNFFSQSFSNVVLPPKGFLLKIIAQAFGRASPFPTGVYLQDIASTTQSGQPVTNPVFPYRIFLEANKSFESFSSQSHDFRNDLNTISTGTTLYDVFAVIPQDPSDESAANIWSEVKAEEYRAGAVKVGKFVSKSEFVASQWADEKLFFKHQRYANKK